MSIAIVHHGDEKHLLYIARVSSNQENVDPGLIDYLMRNGHWSPFEMIGACVEIETTRDIGRQILRHRSFSYQEFSGRYATYSDLRNDREIRFKGGTNRQGSIAPETPEQAEAAEQLTHALRDFTRYAASLYRDMLDQGVAPECARAVLPEGLVPTRMYMNGTLRSWIHYLKERLHTDPKRGHKVAQAEHVALAEQIYDALSLTFPMTFAAIEQSGYIER